jgi:hypothetical protein
MKRIAASALMTRRHRPAGYASQATYFFFLATLRVFFAVFFTALFAFFLSNFRSSLHLDVNVSLSAWRSARIDLRLYFVDVVQLSVR